MFKTSSLFSKDSIKNRLSYISNSIFTLIYDNNDAQNQIKAGEELREVNWILATIADHVLDYYPYSYFMNDDDLKLYPNYLKWFKANPATALTNALNYVDSNFQIIESIERDEWNQHRLPKRNLDEESQIREMLITIQNNLSEIIELLNKPKEIADKSKPTREEIKGLIEAIRELQNGLSIYSDKLQDGDFAIRAFQINKLFEVYKCPLLMAWQTYKFGWHSDFGEEGDTMVDYMLFEVNAKEILSKLIYTLETESPFIAFENNSAITNKLLKVYKHLTTQI